MRTAALIPAPSAFSARDLQRGRDIPALESGLRPLATDLERALAKHALSKPRRHGFIIGPGKWPEVQAALRSLQIRGLGQLVSRGWR